MNKHFFAAVLAVPIFTPDLLAEVPKKNIENIVVTATRTVSSIDDSLAAVTVIDRKKIEQLQAYDFLELLASTPGIDVSRNGGRGANTSVYLRGSNNGHTMVLVDGVRLGSATLGTVSLQHIDLDQVERVEIVRGPRSSLYGSEALGGVIQIFSRQPERQFKPTISFGIGTESTFESSFSVAGSVGKNTVGLTVSHLETAGIDSQVFDGNTDGDDDAYRASSAHLSFSRSFDSGAELAMNYKKSSGEKEYDQGDGYSTDPNSAPYGEFEVVSSNLSLAVPVTDVWLSSLSLGRSTDENVSLDDNMPDFDKFITHRNQASWQNDLQINENYLVTVGYDYLEDEVGGTQVYSKDSRSNCALFAQIQGNISENFDVTSGYRRDKNEQFGYKTTYNIAFGLDLDNAHRLIISRGTGFKAPTFNDLYWPASPWSAGNEDLLPEESVSTELELRGRYDSLSWTLSAYRNEINNLIDWAETRVGFWQPSNIDSAKIVGSELSIATTLGEWNLNVAASYAKPEDELTGRLLARRAKKSIAAQIQRQYNELSVGLNIKSQSHRFDDSANTERLAGYGILGVRLAYVFSKKITGNLALDNILNKDYQLSNDYETSGSSALISINYKM